MKSFGDITNLNCECNETCGEECTCEGMCECSSFVEESSTGNFDLEKHISPGEIAKLKFAHDMIKTVEDISKCENVPPEVLSSIAFFTYVTNALIEFFDADEFISVLTDVEKQINYFNSVVNSEDITVGVDQNTSPA